MKKMFITFCVLFVLVVKTFAQTTYNVFTYKEPVGYKKEAKQGVLMYTKKNVAKGTYCILALYDQTQASASIDQSFTANWQALVAQPYSVSNVPQVENAEEQEGWKTKLGIAQFDFNGGTSAAMLLTLQNGEADANILLITNGKEMFGDLDKLLASLKMAKPKVIAKPTNVTSTNTSSIPNSNSNLAINSNAIVATYADYTIAMPNYFETSKLNGLSVFKTSADFNITITNPYTASGNLEQDVEDAIFNFFPEYKKYESWQSNSDMWQKGETVEGVPYMMLIRDLTKGEYPNEIKRTAGIVVFQYGNKIAIAYGSFERVFAASEYTKYEMLTNQYVYLIQNIRFKGYENKTKTVAIASTQWEAVGNSYADLFGFNANGTWGGASATQSRVGYDATRDKVTTNSWGNDGNWSVKANVLTRSYKSNKKTITYFIRYVSVKNNNQWEVKLGMMSIGENGVWNEARYSKGN